MKIVCTLQPNSFSSTFQNWMTKNSLIHFADWTHKLSWKQSLNDNLGNICDHLSKNPTCSHKHAYWEKQNFKIIHKITDATRKNMQVFIGKEINQNYIPSYSPVHGEFKNLCFVMVSRAFIYDTVNVNKIVIISSTKLPSYPYMQVTTGLTL